MLPTPPPRMSWLQRRRGPKSSEVRGWHRDPQDERFLRHWNGRSWSRDVRVVPSWIAGGPPAIAPQKLLRAHAQGKRRAAAMLSLASAFSVIAAIAAYATAEDLRLPPAPQVRDEQFLSLAAAACNETSGDVADIPRPEAGDSPERTARYVERVADRYDELVGDLSVLPVANSDREAVRKWTTSYAAYTAAGRRYAAALRDEGDRLSADNARRQGNPYKRELLAFAFKNQLPETCVPS